MKNMKKETIKYPRFLTNKLCEQDLFEGKSHDSISQNIANVLDKGSVKIVGLDGGWGSGKSNMVSLIKQKLNSNSSNKYHFYVYDAWGYQTDFQRRSILENLTSYLVDDAKIINHKKWNGRLLQLLSRKRSVGSKITKELSAISKVAAILAILLPIFVLLTTSLYAYNKFLFNLDNSKVSPICKSAFPTHTSSPPFLTTTEPDDFSFLKLVFT